MRFTFSDVHTVGTYLSPIEQFMGCHFGIMVVFGDEWISYYLRVVKIPSHLECITIKYRLGILNENYNMCQCKGWLEYEFRNRSTYCYGYDKWIETSKLNKYKKCNNYILAVDIAETPFKVHIDDLITRIYERLHQEDTIEMNRDMTETVRTLNLQNLELETKVDTLTNEINKLKLDYKDRVDVEPRCSHTVQNIDTIINIDIKKLETLELRKFSNTLLDLHKKVNDEIKERDMCCVCMAVPKNTVFTPCGHSQCCYDCSKQITTCPLCRRNISDSIKLY